MAKAELEAKWAFNIPSVTRKVEGVSGGQLIEVGARPNTGKTSFHASLIAAPGGFAHRVLSVSSYVTKSLLTVSVLDT